MASSQSRFVAGWQPLGTGRRIFCYSSFLENSANVPAGAALNLPIYEDCDSKFGIGLETVTVMAFNPEQTKDF